MIDSEDVDVNMGGGIYGSPLHLAVVKLEIWLIKALIKKGADVNKTDCDGKTALHFVMNLFSTISTLTWYGYGFLKKKVL